MHAPLADAPAQEVADPTAERIEAGHSPRIELAGFTGRVEALPLLARAQQIDLACISLPALLDQLTAALSSAAPLGEKGDWVVMATWLLLLRSRLLLPVATPAQIAAQAEADQMRDRLLALRAIQSLAAWLDRRPCLGRDVFGRGQPEPLAETTVDCELDVIEFLWASLAQFEIDPAVETADTYRPPWLDLYPMLPARERILRLLAEVPEGDTLDHPLPPAPVTEGIDIRSVLRRRSAWTSTFVASLELARQGEVALVQQGSFTPIHLNLVVDGPTV